MTYAACVSNNVKWKADGRVLVPSASDPGYEYHIKADYNGCLVCYCLGTHWYNLCRHVEYAAYLLEHFRPKTAEQREFERLTSNDPVRIAFRQGGKLGEIPRTKRDWNED